MREIKFKIWHKKEKKMYYRGYQKFFHVLLCEDESPKGGGPGRPVKRASYEECEFLEGTGLEDIRGREIFEGDIVRIRCGGQKVVDVVPGVPDMFRSRGLHPLHDLLRKHGLEAEAPELEIEILGNCYESPEMNF